jgi:hypothetical protein
MAGVRHLVTLCVLVTERLQLNLASTQVCVAVLCDEPV